MLAPIAPIPGLFKNGTEYEAGGQVTPMGVNPPRWLNGNLCRFYGAQVGPVGGWRPRTGGHAVTGVPRAMLPWKTNDHPALRWIALGTESRLEVQDAGGAVHDITPAGFISGGVDQLSGGGFGSGSFGGGKFGSPGSDSAGGTDALVWDLDTWNDKLVGCAFCDGRLVQWDGDPGHVAAAITNAPTGCLGTLVAEQGFQFALAPGGSGKTLQWSGQADNTVWTSTTTNQAGKVDLVTFGTLKKGVRLGPVVLVLTEQDAHVGNYVGLPSVWAFERIGSGCGALSKGCVAATGQVAAWWSGSGFWIYDGALRPLDCDVFDYLLKNVNFGQASKIASFHNSQFGEVWWFFPSAGSNENDSYVYWDYRRDHWNLGALARTSAAQAGVFNYPLAAYAAGLVYEHEVGAAYDGAAPYAETGPIEYLNGDMVATCDGIIPDEGTVGQVTVDFRTRPFPNAAEIVLGETTLTSAGRADLRFTARQFKMRVTGASDGSGSLSNWRFGKARLSLSQGGRR